MAVSSGGTKDNPNVSLPTPSVHERRPHPVGMHTLRRGVLLSVNVYKRMLQTRRHCGQCCEWDAVAKVTICESQVLCVRDDHMVRNASEWNGMRRGFLACCCRNSNDLGNPAPIARGRESTGQHHRSSNSVSGCCTASVLYPVKVNSSSFPLYTASWMESNKSTNSSHLRMSSHLVFPVVTSFRNC